MVRQRNMQERGTQVARGQPAPRPEPAPQPETVALRE